MSEAGASVSVVVADDHPIVRSGLCALVDSQPDLQVVAEAGDVQESIRKVKAYKPDVLILDLMMPGGPAFESIPRLKEVSGKTRIVVLTMQSDPGYARATLRGGASGYVLKEAAQDTLIDVIRTISAGGSYVDPEVGSRLAREPEAVGLPDGLSEREAQVLSMGALGHTNREIAERLSISVRTVEAHRVHIQQKIDPSSRAEPCVMRSTRGSSTGSEPITQAH